MTSGAGNPVKPKSRASETAQLLRIVTGVVVIAALYLWRTALIPLALALLLSLLISGVARSLESIGIPRILALFVVVISLCSLAGLIGWKAGEGFTDFTNQLPKYRTTLENKIHGLGSLRSSNFTKVSSTLDELEKEIIKAAPGSSEPESRNWQIRPGSSPAKPMVVEVVQHTNFQNILGSVGSAGLVAIFTIFILLGKEDLRSRFIHLASGGHLTVATQAVDEAADRVQRYLMLQALVNTGYGVVVGTALHLIGIPNSWLWGLASGILRYLPYIGAPSSAVMPVILSLAVFPGWGHTWTTITFFLVLEVAVANFIEPILYGSHVGLSPLAILVASVFWTLIWGFPGLILSTPLTVCLVVIGSYVPSLSFLKILLGDEPAISCANLYYQRLVAGDLDQARQVLDEYLEEKSLEELYSDVVIPALSLAEQDKHRDELDDATQNFILQSTREFIDELGDTSVKPGGDVLPLNAGHRPLNVLCLPARNEADAIVALMLSQLLERKDLNAHAVPAGTNSEMLSVVSELKPQMACISALPPFAVEHAKSLYHQLASKVSGLHIAVCLWQGSGEAEKILKRLKLREGDAMFFTLDGLVEHAIDSVHRNVVRSAAGSTLNANVATTAG
jgi:predicted PurR-regulated permease PerM